RNADSLAYTLATLGLTMDDLTDDFTIYARMARPFHADAVGTLGLTPVPVALSSGVPLLDIQINAATRIFAAIINTAGVDASRTAAIPAGDALEVMGQYQALNAGGLVAIDVGSGLTAFSTAATAFSAFGDTTLTLGTNLFSALFEVKITRGLRTFKQMQEAF
ncbi:MAG: hypothetical protein ACYS5V_01530, partial [Planctomycetota bacterium]